jgi:hypothetical protein
VVLNAVAFLSTALVEGAGRPDVVAKYHVVELPFYLTVLVLLTGAWGITGTAAAWLLRMLWTTPIFGLLALRVARLGWRDLTALGLGRDAGLAAAAIATALAAWWLLRPGWLLGVGIAGAVNALFLALHAPRLVAAVRLLRGGRSSG